MSDAAYSAQPVSAGGFYAHIQARCDFINHSEGEILQSIRHRDADVPVVCKGPVRSCEEWASEVELQILIVDADGGGDTLQLQLEILG